ncbi:MAG: cold shock domain-containing protein [Pseudomonadales bacterium]|jgi:cold shock CspA family protein|nr:cold shock domain-containing protein [Pseudomonadales bacterium]
MKQRILLPAIVIGGLFAVALGFVRGLLPEATDAVLFAVDAAFLVAAVLVYGVLMREASVAAAQASQLGHDAAAATGKRSRNGDRARDGQGRRSGQRDGNGRGGQRGGQRGNERGRGRGGQREGGDREKKAAREERPAAPAGPREDGEIKWFSGAKGYGFIIRPNGDEIFVHHRALRDKSRREIPDGTAVSYVVVDRDKGPQADDVDVTGAEPAENAA